MKKMHPTENICKKELRKIYMKMIVGLRYSSSKIRHFCCTTNNLSFFTKGSGCRKKIKIFLIEQVITKLLKKISVLAQIFTKLWPIYKLHNFNNYN